MRSSILVSIVFCSVLAGPIWADDQPSAADGSAIQSVIGQQLEAFRKEDGAAAEAFAAPGIQGKFPSPEIFMGMVRNSYGALIRPRSTHFDSLTQTNLGVVQKMTVIDEKGQAWTVAYTMTQVDGQWRISGCFVLKADSTDA